LPSCSTNSYSYGSISGLDTGFSTISSLVYNHYLGNAVNTGTAYAAGGGSTTSQTTAGWAVEACNYITGCNVTVGISAGASGVGATVSFPGGAIMANAANLQTICIGHTDPQYQGRSGGCGSCQSNCGGGGGSPIIIDTTGEGFQLTSETDGVRFDIRGDGIPVDLAWTAQGSHNAFLALDRNGNGKIDSGKELFGNFTAQPHSTDPNGYLALAEFDKPENGGNGDGVIDEHDGVYSKLLLWIDENHDGISQPGELHHLEEMGVHSLSLKFLDSPYTDAFGNQFRYKGKVNPLGQPSDDHIDRISYDVFFVLGKPVYSVPKDSQLQSKNGAAPPPVCE
jgi:hypothetical protein